MCVWYLWKPEEGGGSSTNGVTDACKPIVSLGEGEGQERWGGGFTNGCKSVMSHCVCICITNDYKPVVSSVCVCVYTDGNQCSPEPSSRPQL